MAIHAKIAIERVTAHHAAILTRLEQQVDRAIEKDFDGGAITIHVEATDAILNALREIYAQAGWTAKITHHPGAGDQRDWTPAYKTLDLTPKG